MACFRGTPRKHAFSGQASEKHVENSVTIYWFEYAYDQLGNRLAKVDFLSEVQTDYYYDVDVNGTLQADADPRLPIGDLPTELVYTHADGKTVVDSADNRLLY